MTQAEVQVVINELETCLEPDVRPEFYQSKAREVVEPLLASEAFLESASSELVIAILLSRLDKYCFFTRTGVNSRWNGANGNGLNGHRRDGGDYVVDRDMIDFISGQ